MFINTPEIDDDDLFTRPPRSARRRIAPPPIDRTARRACRVCDLTYVVTLEYDGPPLCETCRADIDTTRGRVRRELDGNLIQGHALLATWDAVRAPQQAAWERMRAAEALPDYAERAARHRAAGNIYGQLLAAHAAYEQALAPLSVERDRLERALSVLEGL